jgi:hypothetical protein
MQALMIYTGKCNNLDILRYDVLFILRLINVLFIFVTQLLVGPLWLIRQYTATLEVLLILVPVIYIFEVPSRSFFILLKRKLSKFHIPGVPNI